MKNTSKVGKDDLVRSNNDDLTGTGDGVVTKVYLDTDKDHDHHRLHQHLAGQGHC